MQAMHITAERTFPEELAQRVQRLQISTSQGFEPEGYFQTEFHPEGSYYKSFINSILI